MNYANYKSVRMGTSNTGPDSDWEFLHGSFSISDPGGDCPTSSA